MSFSRWISSVLQLQRETSSHHNLFNESQPLQTWQISSQVELTGARNIDSEGLNDLFQERMTDLGGKENVLLVGEAGYSPEDEGGTSGILEELSSALFESPKNAKKLNKNSDGPNTSLTCLTSRSPSKSRMLDFPIVLAVFRVRLIMDFSNSIKEILKDIQLRTRECGSTIVGMVYSVETFKDEKTMESMEKLRNLMSQVFKDQPWGVCCYNISEPRSILEVKRIITRTMGVTTDGYQLIEDDHIVLERSFRELVDQLGGKERFLILGNICPSARNSEKARVFKEITKALFDEPYKMDNREEHGKSVTPENQKKECIQLPEPRSFPYPLVLVIFRSTFLKEEDNMIQLKEILIDIKSRVTISLTRVIGVVCSDEPLEKPEEQTFQTLLQKILRQTFSCPTGVCSFVRTNLESVDGVKICVCNVLKMS
ncbi:uncharacterized protein ACNLHF_015064 [Anomaloglossus baeobatrachus]|uniref:uncharacterized protein LOC142302151 n=1 Tax=Anomaloglossus baeobatrachus TaxID=238106 RepID=UPI003F4FD4A4